MITTLILFCTSLLIALFADDLGESNVEIKPSKVYPYIGKAPFGGAPLV